MATINEVKTWIEANKFNVEPKMFKKGTKKQKEYAADLMNKKQYFTMSVDYMRAPTLEVNAARKAASFEAKIANGAAACIDEALKGDCFVKSSVEELIEKGMNVGGNPHNR